MSPIDGADWARSFVPGYGQVTVGVNIERGRSQRDGRDIHTRQGGHHRRAAALQGASRRRIIGHQSNPKMTGRPHRGLDEALCSCGLLLRQAVERAETQHQIDGMDARDDTILE